MSSRPSLLIISLTPLRSEPRLLRQIALFRDRFDVVTCGLGAAPDGVAEHIELPSGARNWTSDRRSLLLRRYEHAYWGIPAVDAARRLLHGRVFDAIIAHDVNTLPLAVSLKPRRGIHADMHEFAPRVKDNDFRWRIFVAPYIRWICRKYLPRMTSITAVAPGIAERYQRDFGVQVGVVVNAAPYLALEPTPTGETIRLVHAGAAFRSRMIENYIDAMREAPRTVTLDLIIIPNEPAYVDELRVRAEGVAGVRFCPPVPYADLIATLSTYDVAVSFFPPTTFNLRHALPNKFFEGIQARIGTIIGPSEEMAVYVHEYGLGTMTAGWTVAALRDTFAALDSATVDTWKAGAHAAAHALSAEEQLRGWSEPIEAMFRG